MKRILSIFLIIALIVPLSACGKKDINIVMNDLQARLEEKFDYVICQEFNNDKTGVTGITVRIASKDVYDSLCFGKECDVTEIYMFWDVLRAQIDDVYKESIDFLEEEGRDDLSLVMSYVDDDTMNELIYVIYEGETYYEFMYD